MKEIELIRLYFYLCQCNDKGLWIYNQRFSANSSPNNQKIDDIELLTIYFYCRRFENRHSKREIYDFANRFMRSWFPQLPAYANFNTRLNNLASTTQYLTQIILEELQICENQSINFDVSLIDAMPIMLCSGKRKGKVALEMADKSYCATKGIYYFGVKLHTIAFQRKGTMPFPEYFCITNAAEHDLEAVRQILPNLGNRAIFADKAYHNQKLKETLQINNEIYLLTPKKLIKGDSLEVRQNKKAADDLFSRAVSTVRQPIECFFNWIIEKTGIQRASKVRATKGLLLHSFGALATALLLWLF